ncbi:hypothetical protein BJP62_04310 [Jeongeupia sp. USM3]|nr:hypothetical protein BJP62_04310 [Jeongeupia sp. USM3]
MNKDGFLLARRQHFLSFEAFQDFFLVWDEYHEWFLHNPQGSGSTPREGWLLSKSTVAEDLWCRLNLYYTAGYPIDLLRDELEAFVRALEVYTEALREWHGDPVYPPFLLAELDHYEQLIQLIGLCYLLHRQDLLPRIAALQDGWFAGEDVLYEDFLTFGLADRFAADELFHFKAYTDLHDALYAEEEGKAQAESHLLQYVKRWYKTSMKGLPWHDAHLEPNQAGYFGYWCFEAGAAVLLQGLDDSQLREFPYYPKDMVDWAKRYQADSPVNRQGRCEAGKPCPQAGIWWTPAKPGLHRMFTLGELMPDFPDSSFGATIWYLNTSQG